MAGPYTVRQLVADFVTGHLNVNRQADGALAAQRAMERALTRHNAARAAGVRTAILMREVLRG